MTFHLRNMLESQVRKYACTRVYASTYRWSPGYDFTGGQCCVYDRFMRHLDFITFKL